MSVFSLSQWISPVLFGMMLAGARTLPLHGQDTKTMLAVPPAPLLPDSLRKASDHDEGNGVPSWSGADGQILLEDGIKRYERGTAQTATAHGATSAGTVTVYQFDDATGAYAAYTYLRKSSADRVMLSGVSVVVCDLKLYPESAAALLKTVQVGLPKVGGTKGLSPLLPSYLPAKGLERDTVKYSLGPTGYQATGGVLPAEIVGFDKAAEIVTAKYEGKGTLTLVLYPTPQIAGDHGRQIEAEMNREGGTAGTVKLRREGPLLVLTTGAWKPAEAQSIVENIHLRNELTWNKPMPLEFHSEVRKTVSLLTSIAIFCGLGALAAVVLALFFGGARAAIRIMQGKPAATEPEFLRIDLSGRSASIQSDGSVENPPGVV
ncbi:MAG TPA: DUF6599 family protein [Edaphobacter sp.]|jgi:hypothetical protein|nr:DUF6599 family protein [Edaphobacter sp.]